MNLVYYQNIFNRGVLSSIGQEMMLKITLIMKIYIIIDKSF